MTSSGSDAPGFLKTSRSGSSAANRACAGHKSCALRRSPVAMTAAGMPAELPETGPQPRRAANPQDGSGEGPPTSQSVWASKAVLPRPPLSAAWALLWFPGRGSGEQGIQSSNINVLFLLECGSEDAPTTKHVTRDKYQ